MDVKKDLTINIKKLIRTMKKWEQYAPTKSLFRGIQHILDKNPIPPCGIIHQHMGDSAYQFPVLNDRTTGHE